MIYLDNSATSFPKPPQVYQAYKEAIKSYYSNPGRGGYENSLKTAEKVFETREKTAKFFGAASAENVVFTYNCTQSINTVLKGLLHSGDRVIISDLEHNAMIRPLEKLRRENGIKYDKFRTDFYHEQQMLSNIEQLITPETKLLFCLHSSNVTGFALPLKKMGEICQKHHIYFAVDAAQSAGILPIDMVKYHINFLCIAPHKALFSPMGLGVLITDGTELDTLIEGGTGSFSALAEQPPFLPDRFEAGTTNVSAIAALGSGLDFISNYGRENIYEFEKKEILFIHHALEEIPDIRLYINYDKLREFSPVLSFNIGQVGSEQIAQMLGAKGISVRGGLHCAPCAHEKIGTLEQGTVRISPSIFTNKSDINYTISIIKKLF